MKMKLTPSRKPKIGPDWCRKKAKELRGLRRELRADWREVLLSLQLIIETLEDK